MKTLNHYFAGLLLMLSPTLTWAIPVTDFVDTLFIGGGIMLFIGGLIMLVVPGLFRTGILTTIIADILFVARMLFQRNVENMVNAQTEWLDVINAASIDASRMYTAVLVVCALVAILGTRWLLISVFGSAPPAKKSNTNARSTAKGSSKKTHRKIQRDRDDFSGHEEEPQPLPPPEPETHSPSHTKSFRVHDYLDNLEKQQAYEEEMKRRQSHNDVENTTKIDFGRIER